MDSNRIGLVSSSNVRPLSESTYMQPASNVIFLPIWSAPVAGPLLASITQS